VSLIVGLVHFDPGILQHPANTGHVSTIKGQDEWRLFPVIFLVHVNVGMFQEQRENRVTVVVARHMQQCPPSPVSVVHIVGGILSQVLTEILNVP